MSEDNLNESLSAGIPETESTIQNSAPESSSETSAVTEPVAETPAVAEPVTPEPTVDAEAAIRAEVEARVRAELEAKVRAEMEAKMAAEAQSNAAAPNATAPNAETESTSTESKQQPGDDKRAKGDFKAKKLTATFADLPLRKEVHLAIEQTGYTKPTDIQSEIIPFMLDGRDVLAQSQTGSGKTAAFALPILSRIDMNKHKPQVLVLAPTRELAIQVSRSFETYAAGLPRLNVLAIYGGADYDNQFRKLKKGVHVVVGTPGRVIDHVNRGTLDLSDIQCLVLDEADEMLNMGFLEDVEFVLTKTPKSRQVALFSATMPQPIRNISKRYLNDPAKVTIKRKTATAESIRQRAVMVSPRDKIDCLTRFLEVEETDGVIVFTRTKDATVTVAEQLNRLGFSAIALNGDMPQRTRERTIENLKAGRLDVLVATDVAARGLDVKRISHVFNYDLPEGSESYIHRVGRTGRAGRKGEAIIFLTRSQRGKLKLIERVTKQVIEVVPPPSTDAINEMRVKRFKQKITDVTGEQDLTMFKKLLSDYAEESGKPMEMIAAAVAHMGQRGQPFMMKDRPKKKFDREDRRDGANAGRGRGGRRMNGAVPEGMKRYRIAVGRRDGVGPGNIVGAVANEAGIEGDSIGPIRIFESYSTIDLPGNMPGDVMETLQNVYVSGRQLKLREAGDDDSRPSKRSYGDRKPYGKSGGGFGGKGKRSGGGGGKYRKPNAHGGRGPNRGSTSFNAKRKKKKTR
jgi:ATP-dependent RNA helicase DeaD